MKRFLTLAALAAAVLHLYLFGEAWLRRLLLYLSGAEWARNLIGRTALARRVARRFVAGEDRLAALVVAAELNGQGRRVTLDYLGESVTNREEALGARDEILALLDDIHRTGTDATVSVKLTQLGLEIDKGLALENALALARRARDHDNRLRIDMEESDAIDTTLWIYRQLRDVHNLKNVGVVIQSYLYRSEADVRQLIAEGASVRLCKGAYAEPASVAFPRKDDTDANFERLAEIMLGPEAQESGVFLAVATHDEAMIDSARRYAEAFGVQTDQYEFQMLYGIRRDLQAALVNQGFQVRVYVPYGTAWYPYLVRRLAERPANLWFFVSNFFRP